MPPVFYIIHPNYLRPTLSTPFLSHHKEKAVDTREVVFLEILEAFKTMTPEQQQKALQAIREELESLTAQ